MIHVILYGRKDCHLCEVAAEDLKALQSEIPHELVEIDVDSNAELQKAYGFEVPVVEIGPYKLRAPFTRQELHVTLGAARDRERHIAEIQAVDDSIPTRWSKADGFTYWMSRHYMLFFNSLVILYLGLPVLAPALMRLGITGPAQVIYRGYSAVCHQLAYRSIFLFGEQAFYPRTAAELENLETFQQATGLGEGSTVEELFAARNFLGNRQTGWKIALCQRDVAIYGAILLFGVIFAMCGMRLPTLPWYMWVLLGIAPIGIDGLSQLVSQPPFNLFAFRESTPFFRLLTGGMFGMTTAWFGYPLVEETMRETRQILGAKLLRARKQGAVPPA